MLLTDFPWPDCEVERAILAGIERLAAAKNPVAIMTCWGAGVGRGDCRPLRVVARMGVGLDNIAIPTATARGAWVTNVPDDCVEEVSDHASALILSWSRGVTVLDREVKRGLWQPGGAKVARLRVLTIGLVGLGHIGRATARKLSGFGCRVIAADPLPVCASRRGRDRIVGKIECGIGHHRSTSAASRRDAPSGRRRVPRRLQAKADDRQCQRGGLVDNDALIRALVGGLLHSMAWKASRSRQRSWSVGRMSK